jgi:molybdate transport system substrate-binding protein
MIKFKDMHRVLGAVLISCLMLSAGFAADRNELVISAAASLKDAMLDIQKQYTEDRKSVSLVFNFGASGSLQQQIEQGAPVDIFISAANTQIDALKAKGLLVDSSIIVLVGNMLVLVVPGDSPFKGDFASLKDPVIKKIALGEVKSVPAGQYALEVFNALKIKDDVLSKGVFARDVREVLAWVETGNADAGIVYKTDANIAKGKVRIVATAPDKTHKKIVYPAAIIKDSKNIKAAKEFLSYLEEKKAQAVFAKYGFVSMAK